MTDTPMIPADVAAARVAAAYEAAAKEAARRSAEWATSWALDHKDRHSAGLSDGAHCLEGDIRALAAADPDGQAALACLLAAAKAEGMREAAGMLTPDIFQNVFRCKAAKDAILAAADKVAET